MAAPPIQPRTLKGFRDFLPETMLPRERIMDIARRVFRSYGFSPIDTPALEYLDVLLGKGGAETDKQLYRFQDHGGRDVGMRFDLTVPLARFAAQHIGELGTPFKRYHIATVWRGENTQRGRYREFMQCDFDTIGTKSVAADAETVLVAHDLLCAIGFDRFTIHINHRAILNGFVEKNRNTAKTADVLRVLDKFDKVGEEGVANELANTPGATPKLITDVLSLAMLTGSDSEILQDLSYLVSGSELGEFGVEQLRKIITTLHGALSPIQMKRIRIAPKIARGLDYYTGTVLETTLDDLPTIGSVCSGGRYDNLAELYTKQELPGIGASLGLDRLLAAMEELGMIDKTQTPAQVFIPYFDSSRLGDYFKLAADLRSAGLAVEVYPEPTKLGKQLQYADRKGFRVAVIVGEREFLAGECQIKNLANKESTTVPLANVAAEVQQILAN